MKRIIITVLGLFVLATISAQDLCAEKYKQALSLYASGRYVEAQQLFIVVAQSCGNYVEVYKKLKDCNAKIKEKQTAYANEISTLKEKNKKLTEQYNAKKSEYSDSQRRSAIRIDGFKTKIKMDSIQLDSVSEVLKSTETKLYSAEKNIQRLKQDSALLRQELDSVTHLKDSLQNKLDWWKIKKNTVRDDGAKLNTENSIEFQNTEVEDNGSRNTEGTPEESNQTPAKQEEPSEVEQEQKSN